MFGMEYGQTWRQEDNEVKATLKRKLQVEQSPRTLPTPATSMYATRYEVWIGKTSKRKVAGAPKLKSIPSTSEAF